ncbi:MAG: sulfatase-like hydrolase/transferase [Planctomycetota bacterium]|jgi:arylsulfatase A-like enzyme|nr:sulfatase-like hydrolase/transferase [Planctomycetota bacterium]
MLCSDEYPRNTGGAYALPFPEEVSQTNWITGHSLDFIEKQSGEQPFFAQISYVQPHSPFAPPGQYLDNVIEEKLPEPLPAEWLEDPNAPQYFRDNKPVCPDDWRYGRKCYFADVVHLDAQLGRVLDTLGRKGMRENSFVVFLSDHGELLYDHGFSGKEERHYDACIRVPLIISGPGLQQGEARSEFVQLEDICPTILDMADCAPEPMPKIGPYLSIEPEDIPVLPGRTLLPLCRGDEVSDWRDSAYCESYNRINSNDYHYWVRTIRTAGHRYSFYAQNSGEQLFDLQADPDEQNNLCKNDEYAEVRQDLRDRLMELIVQQDYPKTRRNLFSLGVH